MHKWSLGFLIGVLFVLTGTLRWPAPTPAPQPRWTRLEAELYARRLQAAQQALAAGADRQAWREWAQCPLAERGWEHGWVGRQIVRPHFLTHDWPANTYSLTISPNGVYLVAQVSSQPLRIWHLPSGKELRPAVPYPMGLDYVRFNANSSQFVGVYSINEQRRLGVWDVTTGTCLRQVQLPASHSWDFNPDSGALVWIESHGVRVTQTSAEGHDQFWSVGAEHPQRAALSPCGRWLATVTQHRVWLGDLTARKWVANRPEFEAGPRWAFFSQDGQQLAVVGEWLQEQTEVQIHRSATGERLGSIAISTQHPKQLMFSPCGAYLLMVDQEDVVSLWSVRTGRKVYEILTFAGQPTAPVFSADGRSLVMVINWDQEEGQLVMYPLPAVFAAPTDLPSGQEQWVLRRAAPQGPPPLDDDRAASVTSWFALPKLPKTYASPEPSGEPQSIELTEISTDLSADGQGLIVIQPNQVRYATGSQFAQQVDLPLKIPQTSPFAFSPAGRWCAFCSEPRLVQLYDRHERKLGPTLKPADNPITQLVFTANGERLIGHTHNWELMTWNLVSGQVAAEPAPRLDAFPWQIGQIDPSGTYWSVRTWSRLGIWHLAERRWLWRQPIAESVGIRPVFSANGHYVAALHNAGVQVWTTATGVGRRIIRPAWRYQSGGEWLPLSADGRRLFTTPNLVFGGYTGPRDTVWVWDADTGVCLLKLPMPNDGASELLLDEANARLLARLTKSSSFELRIWPGLTTTNPVLAPTVLTRGAPIKRSDHQSDTVVAFPPGQARADVLRRLAQVDGAWHATRAAMAEWSEDDALAAYHQRFVVEQQPDHGGERLRWAYFHLRTGAWGPAWHHGLHGALIWLLAARPAKRAAVVEGEFGPASHIMD